MIPETTEIITKENIMQGIIKKQRGRNIIIEIHYLSDELQQKINSELTTICHGEYALTSESIHHSFERTIRELVQHRLPEAQNKRIGAIGELLLNVIIRSFTSLRIISPFFNLEERNVKKGFDIIAIDEENRLWLVESKAGKVNPEDTATQKLCERIKTAKNDLYTRLNQGSSQLWLNAINSVRGSLDDTSEKKTIENIIAQSGNSDNSNDKNVILGGVIFCLFNSQIDSEKLDHLYQSIARSNDFEDLQIIAIQQPTYEAIYNFLCELI